jgi:Fe-Mn family superoxide dismutase
MAFELPELPYDYEALQPYMSKETLEFHHDKHHKAYVDNGNKLCRSRPGRQVASRTSSRKSFGKNARSLQQRGQHYNHIHFWKWMKKGGGGKSLPGALQKAVDSDLGGYRQIPRRLHRRRHDAVRFGLGVARGQGRQARISKTPNGENPLVHGAKPILGVDVWEHSYYIDYRNARPKYLEAFVDSLINWDYVLEMHEAASK